MVNKQLINYIQKELRKGFSEEQIRQPLVKTGWTITDIDDAFKSIKAVPKETKPKKLDPEQVLKEIVGEETKKGQITKESVKTKEFPFNRKRLIILAIIGLFVLLLISYYIYEYIQS